MDENEEDCQVQGSSSNCKKNSERNLGYQGGIGKGVDNRNEVVATTCLRSYKLAFDL